MFYGRVVGLQIIYFCISANRHTTAILADTTRYTPATTRIDTPVHTCMWQHYLLLIICWISCYRLLNEYSVLGPSSLIGIWSSSLGGDQSDHRTRSQHTLYEFNNRIIIYLYKIINLIKYHQIYIGLLIIIKCVEHQFIPKHRIRIDIAFICMLA